MADRLIGEDVNTGLLYSLERYGSDGRRDWVEIVQVQAYLQDGAITFEAWVSDRITTSESGRVTEEWVSEPVDLDEDEVDDLRVRLRPRAIEICNAILQSVGLAAYEQKGETWTTTQQPQRCTGS